MYNMIGNKKKQKPSHLNVCLKRNMVLNNIVMAAKFETEINGGVGYQNMYFLETLQSNRYILHTLL